MTRIEEDPIMSESDIPIIRRSSTRSRSIKEEKKDSVSAIQKKVPVTKVKKEQAADK